LTSSIGLGIIIGNYGFVLAYVFMFIMAMYDYIAVFVTKHMLILAKAASNENLSLLIGSSNVEVVPRAHADKKVIAELKNELKKNQIKDPVIKEVIESGEMPVLSQIQLGAGDLTLPLVMSVGLFMSMAYFSVPTGSAATINVYYLPMVAALGAVAGLIFTMWLLKRYSVALPAIPPLFAVMNFFIGFGMLTYSNPSNFLAGIGMNHGSYTDYYMIAAGMIIVGAAFLLLMLITLERNRNKQKSVKTSKGKTAQKS
jgi:presenilin-like A22 family membrane protease